MNVIIRGLRCIVKMTFIVMVVQTVLGGVCALADAIFNTEKRA